MRHKTKKGDLFFYTYNELQELLEKNIKIDPQIITQRKKGYIYWIKDGKCHLYTGTTATRLLDQLDHRENNNRRNELKGISTIKRGIISGKVKIILHNKNLTQQIKEFKKGYILVTEMIRPESIVLSKKAKALITDEGGIISHAAIISREYGIPCIIGTKVATKVLKNGDPIELNTTTGVIKQL